MIVLEPLLPSPLGEEKEVMVALALASVFAASPPPPGPPTGLLVGVLPLLPLAGCGPGGCCGVAAAVEKREKTAKTRRVRVRNGLLGL